MLNIHQKYCRETFYCGQIEKFEAVYDDTFNFAYDVVDAIAEKEPDRRAMLWCNEKGEEHTFTFSDISKKSNQAANLFSSYGIKRGDKVMLILKRHYQFWFCMMGLCKLGAIAVPVTNQLQKKDIVYRCGAGNIKAIVCTTDGEIAEHVEASMPESPTVQKNFSVHGKYRNWIDFDAELGRFPETFERRETSVTDTMLLSFTSGTTGMPKMVCHDFAYPVAHIFTAKYWHNVDPEGLHLTISDTGWLKAMWGKLYGQWFMEAGIFVYDFDRFIASDILKLFKKYNITTFCAPPTMYRFFIKEDLSAYDLSSLKYATIAGEPLNPEVFNQFYKATGLKLMEGFGQSETTLVLCNYRGMTPKPGSTGKPSPAYHVDLVDENGKSVPAGTVGEIVIRTGDKKPAGLFANYHDDMARTRSTWENGIYHTGDTAWKDEDGYYWYVGRNDDIIKSSGYRIGPFEIESVLMEHPAVLECAVTGAPDPVRGQVVKATIVPARGYEPTEELKKEIQDFVKKQTAPYKYPRIIEFVTELPKTISGKVKRTDLRDKK